MKKPFKNKRGQFGPDALIGMVLVAVLGLGGIFFLNVFVNGLALDGLLSILDTELDQRCFYVLYPLMGDEYIRAGASQENILIELQSPQGKEVKPYLDQQNYFGGEDENMLMSKEFQDIIIEFNSSVSKIENFPMRVERMEGYIAENKKAAELRDEKFQELEHKGPRFCSVPVYSPTGRLGTAEIFIVESE